MMVVTKLISIFHKIVEFDLDRMPNWEYEVYYYLK